MRLLVDAGEFMDALETDLGLATTSALAQTMSFEGDYAGRRFANLLVRSRCPDRRLVVDCFSRHVMSCRHLSAFALDGDAELRNEVHATAATHEAMRRAGVQVRFCNPAGRLLRRLPARDHKKIVVIDRRISYLGGINITDHNFGWHDLMLRIDDEAVADFLAEDLEATWRNRSRARWRTFDRIAIGSLDGRHNASSFEPVFDLIASARDEIVVQTPYLTFPFTDRLADARRRGVRVRILAPAAHPQPSFARFVEWECARSGVQLHLLPGMTHVKAMLVDGSRLLLGSSNFDYLSYRLLRELIAIVEDADVIADFIARVDAVDSARAHIPRLSRSTWTGRFRRSFMSMAGEALVRLSRA
jgi:cardiolipin synthase